MSLKHHLRPGLWGRLRQKFLREPAGYGRPIPVAALDHEYTSGAWAHFHDQSELPRYAAIVDLACAGRSHPSILDLGCGSGRLAQLFQSHGPRRYLGVDLSAAGLKQATALTLSGCEFVRGDFESWRPTETFDVVIFNETIGYAHDPGAMTRAFLPSVAPNGVMIVSHYRSGHWAPLWRRIEAEAEAVAAKVITNDRGQMWDIKVLQARS